ncbi:hypothetical protein KAJ61_01600 [Candidatus Parcubacteria bacterium]|nr:hypothetical protein [Candidatus Parcubacteria bacterium]
MTKEEQRKEKIFKKVYQVFSECGFRIEAKDVIDRKFVVSHDDDDDSPLFGTISSFEIIGNSVWLYPHFERSVGWNKVDVIILSSGKIYSSDLNAIYVFRNNPDSEIFFDFI